MMSQLWCSSIMTSLGKSGYAARPSHDQTDFHVRETVLFCLAATLVRYSHMKVETQRHRFLPQLGISFKE